jgi:flagellar biosynthesis protein FlhF
MKEALRQIRQELGEEALIISTREMTAPLGRKFVEVTAAAEDSKVPVKQERPAEPQPRKSAERLEPSEAEKGADLAEQILQNRHLLSESLKPLKDEIFQLRSIVNELRRASNVQPKVDLEPLHEEVRGLKRLFNSLSRSVDFDKLVHYSQPLKDIYHLLVSNEVEESISLGLIEMLEERLEDAEKHDPSTVRKAVHELIESSISAAKPVILNQRRPTVMAFVGPTGVGKTTTIAKLAARCTLQMKKKVTLITIDTYRIAAVEQLKTYAKIMDLPIFVCYNVEDMRRTIRESADSALILIDTAGHSQTDAEQVKDLRTYFSGKDGIDVLLVLSATTKSNDLKDITDRFSVVGASKLVFTKLDETTTYGPLLNETVRTRLPIGYFTTGQNVPDDIETATPAKLARMILSEH